MDGGTQYHPCPIEYGWLDKAQYERVAALMAQIRAAPFYVVCKSGISVQQIAAMSRYYKHTAGIECVYIDYVQLLEFEGQFREDWAMQQAASKHVLNGVSRGLNLAVVGASQLSRTALSSGKTDVTFMPGGENVAGSVQWWRDCDAFVVPLTKTSRQIEKWPNTGSYGFNISKNRNGPSGLIHAKLRWHILLMVGVCQSECSCWTGRFMSIYTEHIYTDWRAYAYAWPDTSAYIRSLSDGGTCIKKCVGILRL